MNKYFGKYIDSWWLPIISYIGLLGVYVIGTANGSRLVFKIFPFLTTIIGFGLLASILKVLFSRKWYRVIGQLIIGLFSTLCFIIMFNPRDLLFSNLKIPENLEYAKPIEINSGINIDSVLSINESNGKLILANYGQPGMYKIFTKVVPSENGQIFLKAFEEVGDIQLSAESLRAETRMKVFKNERINYTPEFTIYEGVWGSFYVGRIELWFISSNMKEYKLSEDLFLIEGWIR